MPPGTLWAPGGAGERAMQTPARGWVLMSPCLMLLPPTYSVAKSLQSCMTLCDPIDGNPPGSSVLGILQARILEWVVISFSNTCMHAKSLQLCPTLCDPMDSSPPGSSVHRILQARILEWVAISFSNACRHAKSLQLCPTLCDPMDSSPPGSSVHRILQARILEWVAISYLLCTPVIWSRYWCHLWK